MHEINSFIFDFLLSQKIILQGISFQVNEKSLPLNFSLGNFEENVTETPKYLSILRQHKYNKTGKSAQFILIKNPGLFSSFLLAIELARSI
jgi:hypothetical protein